ncbi:MAG: hypothetical protein M1831_006817 [Alyxoria varia]|nr:MAG: hypothetical protein M1831_006817 [Alyxoria varia]
MESSSTPAWPWSVPPQNHDRDDSPMPDIQSEESASTTHNTRDLPSAAVNVQSSLVHIHSARSSISSHSSNSEHSDDTPSMEGDENMPDAPVEDEQVEDEFRFDPGPDGDEIPQGQPTGSGNAGGTHQESATQHAPPPPPPPPAEALESIPQPSSPPSDPDDGRPPWFPIPEDDSEPGEDEIARLQSAGEHSALDHTYWENKTFRDLNDPEYVPRESGRIEWTVPHYNGTKQHPNRDLVRYSHSVKIGDYSWRLKLYPKGNGSSYMGIYVECQEFVKEVEAAKEKKKRKQQQQEQDKREAASFQIDGASKQSNNEVEPAQNTQKTEQISQAPDQSRDIPQRNESSKEEPEISSAQEISMDQAQLAQSTIDEKQLQETPKGQETLKDSTEDVPSTVEPQATLPTPMPLLGNQKIRQSRRITAQLSVMVYNPNEPRVHFHKRTTHGFTLNDPDRGFYRFGPTPVFDLGRRLPDQRQALLRNDTLAFIAHLRVVDDPTGFLYARDDIDYRLDFTRTGLRAIRGLEDNRGTANNLTSAISTWILLPPIRRLLYQASDHFEGQRPPLLAALIEVLCDLRRPPLKAEDPVPPVALLKVGEAIHWHGVCEAPSECQDYLHCHTLGTGISKVLQDSNPVQLPWRCEGSALDDSDVVQVWEVILETLETELQDTPYSGRLRNMFGDQGFRYKLPAGSTNVRAGLSSMPQSFQNTPLPHVLQVELPRQKFDHEKRRWEKLHDRISTPHLVRLSNDHPALYLLYGLVSHQGWLNSRQFVSFVNPNGHTWFKVNSERPAKLIKLTEKQAVQENECSAYIAIYVRNDLANREIECQSGTFIGYPEDEWTVPQDILDKYKPPEINKVESPSSQPDETREESEDENHEQAEKQDSDQPMTDQPLADQAMPDRPIEQNSKKRSVEEEFDQPQSIKKVEFDYFSGEYYSGNVHRGYKHGQGNCIYMNGDVYTGDYRKGKRHGKGEQSFFNGDRYEGDWEDDKMHGTGKLVVKSTANTYQGGFEKGKQHGQFTLTGEKAETLKSWVMRFLQIEWHNHERQRNSWDIERAEMKAKIAKQEGECRSSRKLNDLLDKQVQMLEKALRYERAKNKAITAGEEPPTKEEVEKEVNGQEHERRPSTTSNVDKDWPDSEREAQRERSKMFLQKCVEELTYVLTPPAHPLPPQPQSANDFPPDYQMADAYLNQHHQQQQQQQQQQQAANQQASRRNPQSHLPSLPNHHPPPVRSAPEFYANQQQHPQQPPVFRNNQEQSSIPITTVEEVSAPSMNVQNPDENVERITHSFDSYGHQLASQPEGESNRQDDSNGWNFDDNAILDAPPPEIPRQRSPGEDSTHLSAKSPPRHSSHRRKSSGSVGDIRRRSDGSHEIREISSGHGAKGEPQIFQVRFALRGHLDVVRSIIFTGGGTPSEPEICTTGDDGTIKRWIIPTSYSNSGSDHNLDIQSYFTHRGHEGSVTCLAACPASSSFSTGGRMVGDGWIFSGGQDSMIRVWERGRVDPKATLEGHTDSIWALSVLPATCASIFGQEGTASPTTSLTPNPVQNASGRDERILLVSGAADNTVKIWAVSAPPQLTSPSNNSSGSRRGVGGSRRHSVTSGSGFPSSPQPSTASGTPFHYQLIHSISYPPGADSSPTCITPLGASGESFVVAYSDSSVLIFDTRTGEQVVGMASGETYDGTVGTGVNSVVVASSGEGGVGGSSGNMDASGDDVCAEPHGATGSVKGGGVEGVVISGHEDRFVRFFDANSGQCTYSMLAHPSAIASLSLSPDGRELVSAGHDASLRFWSLEKRSCAQEIGTSHRVMRGEGVNCAVWSGDGRYVVSGGGDGVVKVFGR